MENEAKTQSPYFASLHRKVLENPHFRRVLFTGEGLQAVIMCLSPRESLGLEVHPGEDCFFTVEQGRGRISLGETPEVQDLHIPLSPGISVFIPRGMWHNVENLGRNALKLSVLYAPPRLKEGTLQPRKEDAHQGEQAKPPLTHPGN